MITAPFSLLLLGAGHCEGLVMATARWRVVGLWRAWCVGRGGRDRLCSEGWSALLQARGVQYKP